jgi:hypothetical protein
VLNLDVGGRGIEVARNAVDFGAQALGSLGAGETITVSSELADRTVHARLLFDREDFVTAFDDCSGVRIVHSCDIRVRFAPTALGGRIAILLVTDDATGETRTVGLGGTGVDVPPGPKGDKGDPGQPGTTGPEGPRGLAGQVTCRNTAAARLLCDALFAPGTWKPAGATTPARFTLSRGGHIRARGRATVNRDGRVRMHLSKPRRLHKGAYVLKVRVRHAVVLRRTLRIR